MASARNEAAGRRLIESVQDNPKISMINERFTSLLPIIYPKKIEPSLCNYNIRQIFIAIDVMIHLKRKAHELMVNFFTAPAVALDVLVNGLVNVTKWRIDVKLCRRTRNICPIYFALKLTKPVIFIDKKI